MPHQYLLIMAKWVGFMIHDLDGRTWWHSLLSICSASSHGPRVRLVIIHHALAMRQLSVPFVIIMGEFYHGAFFGKKQLFGNTSSYAVVHLLNESQCLANARLAQFQFIFQAT